MLFPIKQLIEDHGDPLCVPKTTTVREALTMMVENDYSQLPIKDDEGNLIGILTEASIINTYYHVDTSLSLLDLSVDHCMTSARTISPDSDIFEALNILEDVYAVVVVENKKPVGILTDYDTTHFFRNLSEGLIMVEDIEVTLRRYIEIVFDTDHKMDSALMRAFKENKKDPTRPAKEYQKISFSDHVQLIITDQNWEKISYYLAPKEMFIKLMQQVADIRNQLAHFRGKLEPIQRNTLLRCSDWLSSRPKPSVDEKITLGRSASIKVNDNVSSLIENKNDPLKTWLIEQRGAGHSRVQLLFTQIEELSDIKLPDSARIHRSWWTNDISSHPQSYSWIAAGWVVDDVDITKEEVTLRQTNLALYQPFFSDLLARLKAQRPGITQAQKAYLQNWLSFSAGASGFYFGWVLPKEPVLRVELYIDKGEKDVNKAAFEALKKDKDAIEAQIAEKLKWTPLPDARASRIYAAIPFNVTQSQEEHEKAKDWGIEMMFKFIDAFRPRLRGL